MRCQQPRVVLLSLLYSGVLLLRRSQIHLFFTYLPFYTTAEEGPVAVYPQQTCYYLPIVTLLDPPRKKLTCVSTLDVTIQCSASGKKKTGFFLGTPRHNETEHRLRLQSTTEKRYLG
ncbi:hypothetical protein C8Q69DRAFT_69446 [Paecilomyces variotii]|uniref:Uncharacterized protein n=1 Tax=Byssochlamys spectabilis TaxID=264951 RepID=A0A443HNQ3_BYSSP|nr:hypothetical protein C8Q69DRAFT_69446 [Paecilomyces variotii]RWQ93404.1 hypothetical protein C8Q69DRAFT_69446 [Paecilomyces variotii]